MIVKPKNNPSSWTARRTIVALACLVAFMVICPLSVVNIFGTSIGLETSNLDLSLKYRESKEGRKVQPSPLLLDFTGTDSALAWDRGCNGWSFELGDARLNLMGCTTVITP